MNVKKMSPRSREELPVLRRSCRRASMSRLNPSLINWNNEKFSNSAFSVNESEDSVVRRPEKRSRKNDTVVAAQQHRRVSTTDSTRRSPPVTHGHCSDGSSTDEEEERSTLQSANNLKNSNHQTKKRTRRGTFRTPVSDVSMTPASSLRASRLTRRTQVQTASLTPIGDTADDNEEELELSELSSNRSIDQFPEESGSVLSIEESDRDDVMMSSSINESTGEIEEERTSDTNSDTEQTCWENIGETKADDDRYDDE